MISGVGGGLLVWIDCLFGGAWVWGSGMGSGSVLSWVVDAFRTFWAVVGLCEGGIWGTGGIWWAISKALNGHDCFLWLWGCCTVVPRLVDT